jgi:hypothetical protein
LSFLVVKHLGDVDMRHSVDEYHSLLARAISALERDTAEAREDLYQRARTTLKAGLEKLDPSPSYEEIFEERLNLDFAIHDLEWSIATEVT